MTAKTVNYTPEQTAQMVADYQAGTTVETIANALGKTVRSVVAKLSREKVYVAKTYVSKTGEAVVKKDEVADYIAQALGLGEADADSLTKANKTALKAIADFIRAEKTWTMQGLYAPAFLWYNTLMNTNQYIVGNMSGAYYDALMQACPGWVWTDQEFEDYFQMMTGA